MMLSNENLNELKGGRVSATAINAYTRAGQFLYDLGRSFGSTLRSIFYRSKC